MLRAPASALGALRLDDDSGLLGLDQPRCLASGGEHDRPPGRHRLQHLGGQRAVEYRSVAKADEGDVALGVEARDLLARNSAEHGTPPGPPFASRARSAGASAPSPAIVASTRGAAGSRPSSATRRARSRGRAPSRPCRRRGLAAAPAAPLGCPGWVEAVEVDGGPHQRHLAGRLGAPFEGLGDPLGRAGDHGRGPVGGALDRPRGADRGRGAQRAQFDRRVGPEVGDIDDQCRPLDAGVGDRRAGEEERRRLDDDDVGGPASPARSAEPRRRTRDGRRAAGRSPGWRPGTRRCAGLGRRRRAPG